MRQGKSIIVNTIALYVKIILSGVVLLLSTKIALSLLGADSFGLYNLIAGVIAMLSFLNGALLVSTQRYLSVTLGEGGGKIELLKIFNSSMIIHLGLIILLLLLLLLLKPFLFDSFLNITPELVTVAERVYDIMIVSSLATILTVPYNAAINAHEEMWMFAIIETIVAILKLVAVYALYITPFDLLLTYTFLMFIAILVGCLCKYLWCRKRYCETRISIKEMLDFKLVREQISFVGWNTFGSIAVLGRNQGVAVVLNLFFGTMLNASYGIANQINSLVTMFSASITTVFSPLIMKYQGKSDKEKMLYIAVFSSKISFFLSALMSLPILLELDKLLSIWLTDVPEYTFSLCYITILVFLVLQLYPGIARAIYAVGRIKWYQITISITILIILPMGYYLFELGFAPPIIVNLMLVTQIAVFGETVFFAYKLVGLDWKAFLVYALKSILCFCFAYFIGTILRSILELNIYIEILVVSLFVISIFVWCYWFVVFSLSERTQLFKSLKSFIKR